MRERIRPRDWEALSAYLDGELTPKERARLEARLQASADLRLALDELRRTRAVLRLGGQIRAPRNFTLTSSMVARPKERPAFGLFAAMRLTSALATALFLLVLLGDLLTGAGQGARRQMAAQPAPMEALKVQPAFETAPSVEATPAVPEMAVAPSEEAMKALGVGETPEAEALSTATEAALTEALRSAPLPPEAGGSPISPTEEVEIMAMAPAITPTLEATSAPAITPTLEATSTPAITPTQVFQESAQPYPDRSEEGFETGERGRNLWRILEVGLAIIGLASGLVAYSLARAGRK